MRSLKCRAAALAIAALMLAQSVSFAVSMNDKIEIAFSTEAAAMALIEAETGTTLAEQNADLPLPMASTTKIMTALVVIENCALDELVAVDDSAVGVEGSSMYLVRGELVTVEDLLYGLMLASGNDAAVALACHAGGSVEKFVSMMNSRTESMGLVKTHFVTPNGLTAEGHQTTALELCLIAREAMKNETFRKIVSTQYHTAQSGAHVRTFKNKNALLWDYPGAVGVKTGYTMAAGRCLVFAAEREGMLVIGALLNCRPMFEKAARLLDFAFENYTLCTVVPEGQMVCKVQIKNGLKNVLSLETKNSIITVMQKGEASSFTAACTVDEVTAPVTRGDVVGSITVYHDGVPLGTSPLIAAESVGERGFLFWLKALSYAFAA